jgi:hypothetical protein
VPESLLFETPLRPRASKQGLIWSAHFVPGWKWMGRLYISARVAHMQQGGLLESVTGHRALESMACPPLSIHLHHLNAGEG